ncbi:cytochrome P450 [Nocardia sp. NBC_00565]|uniref:cytochrome P450 n=1 Tax=Nocardia sp. NBC_00565 TaxID=2975993 RepID=UPI002E801BA5|nr:cytochrome P450 [Nocardia sp. NBC_00565]WUC04720.1 cytochrome P450 [Nocardia sp. NBC_00565]
MTHQIPGTMLLDPQVIDDPYPFYRRLHAEAPVWQVPGAGVFTVSTFELVAEAVGRVDAFSSNMKNLLYRDDAGLPARFHFGDAGGQALATADPPLHAIHRGAVFPELVAKRMNELEPDIVELADELVTAALKVGTVEFMTVIGNIVPMTMISRLIGFRDSNLDELWNSAVNGTRMLGSTLSFDELIEIATSGDSVRAWIADQLCAARKDPGEDLLGAVARSVNDDVVSEHEGMTILTTLLSAGGETTTSLLGNAVRILADNPELQEHLRQNPGQIPTFAEEALRLESPFRYLMRSVPEDTTLGSVEIPADSTVLLLWGAANRDAAEFERPDEIDLGRRVPRRHVAFGRGIHTCVGAPLARLEARIVLTILLQRTTNITLEPQHRPSWVTSLLVRRHLELPVRLHVR